MWNTEFDTELFEAFRSNSTEARVVTKLGLVKEAMELRILTTSYLTVDIFLTYKINDTFQSNGYHYERILYQQLLLNFNESNLCSGELLETKYIVPCNPEAYLSFQYGENKWKMPLKDNYFNYDSIKFFKNWSEQDWPFVVRYYDFRTRELLDKETLEYINKFAVNAQLRVLPDNLF